jgi:hypothetical protein
LPEAEEYNPLKPAKELGCYQVGSVIGYDHSEDQQPKLAIGFGLTSIERERPSLAIVMQLQLRTMSREQHNKALHRTAIDR